MTDREATSEIPRCRCGFGMVPTDTGKGYYCVEHDRPHVEELSDPPQRRVRSHADQLFDLAFARQAREWYPNRPGRVG